MDVGPRGETEGKSNEDLGDGRTEGKEELAQLRRGRARKETLRR